MGETLQRIRDLVANGAVRVLAHGYDELATDDIMINDIVGGVNDGMVVEDYPDYSKGHAYWCCCETPQVSQSMSYGEFPLGKSSPAVVVTAYRPDPDQWAENFIGRKR